MKKQEDNRDGSGCKNDKDQIYLKDFVEMLNRGKVLILISLILFTSLATVYSFTASEWWTSKAKVELPDVSDTAPAGKVVAMYSGAFKDINITGSYSYEVNTGSNEEKAGYKSIEYGYNSILDDMTSDVALFKRFVDLFNSPDNKVEFFESSSIFSSAIKSLNFSDSEKGREYRVKINEWLARINAKPVGPRTENIMTLFFQSHQEKVGLDLLVDYISFTNGKVADGLTEDIKAVLSVRESELVNILKTKKNNAKSELELIIKKGEYGLIMAKTAEIEKPLERFNAEKELFPFDLGTIALEEKLKILKTIEDYSIIDPSILKLKEQLVILSEPYPDLHDLKSFSYLDKPDQPLSHDQPKRLLIVLFGMFFGLFMGVLLVVLRNALK
ncbi:Wzz/FepE/Etk N-terminal domain-containing protein [Enterovibrio norvegicus]|uniref:Wzz/FepE/Etk N-terminal domain-containing protein n=1 Tax=Enterovibrio norvegicus TaxID=188144 RepID=UPI000C851286|nr:Wzz/FepE/Etk N-terminal domain-containing protein [Enterovibrio norvegicus]PMH72468.1 hypothetical protein BCU62_02315 [Enterovibrio norvegicus]